MRRARDWAACFLLVALAAGKDAAPVHVQRQASHDFIHENNGKLVFTQVKAEASSRRSSMTMGHAPLFNVEVNFDIEEMSVQEGVTIVYDKKTHRLRLENGLTKTDGVAWGYLLDNIATTGWAELYLEQSACPDTKNDVKMYAAGYVEGILTSVRISEHYANMRDLLKKDPNSEAALPNIKKMWSSEIAYMKAKANLEPHIMTEEPEDEYWKHARYNLFQLWGLTDGYNFVANHFNVNTFEFEDMLLLNSGGQLMELVAAYTPQAVAQRAAAAAAAAAVPSFLQQGDHRDQEQHRAQGSLRGAGKAKQEQGVAPSNATRVAEDLLDDQHWEQRVAKFGHCSALVKLTEGNADLLMGHTTWSDYSTMMRIYKYYTFHLLGANTMCQQMAFSSYPGAISSTDSFYELDSGLAVMETTLEMLNPQVYDKVPEFPFKPHVPSFIHVMIANRLAKTAAHWARIYERYNPGTYSAQWMVVDYNQFTSGKAVPDNTLWVIETVPGLTHSEDLSSVLQQATYWPSFNRPFFDDVREVTGFSGAQQSHGDMYSYSSNPRAKIFKKIDAESLWDMRNLMTSNYNPLSPGHQISARMDLSPVQPIPVGGIDAKVINRCLKASMAVQAKSAPSHDNVPVFRWTNEYGGETWYGWPHRGLPDVWSFGFVQISPAGPGGVLDVASC